MGMDVYGRSPSSEAGEYFRRNVWGWHPLADYCEAVAPEICQFCEHWHSNDGDGLDAELSARLADVLAQQLDSGKTATFIAQRNAEMDALPGERCHICNGSGQRTDAIAVAQQMPERDIPPDAMWGGKPHPRAGQTGWCNGCDGRGVNRPFLAEYQLDEQTVRDWIEFLRGCGGFSIH